MTDRVQRLVDAESACCSFFTFTVLPSQAGSSAGPGEAAVELTIEVPAEVPAAHTAVLEAIATRAEQVQQAAS